MNKNGVIGIIKVKGKDSFVIFLNSVLNDFNSSF